MVRKYEAPTLVKRGKLNPGAIAQPLGSGPGNGGATG